MSEPKLKQNISKKTRAPMFHPEMNPEKVLTRLMEDSIETIRNLKDAGYPLNYIPPHASSVYLISKDSDATYVGIGKSDIEVLTSVERSEWAPRALYRLDCESDEHHYPLGTFIGFVGSSEGAPHIPLFFGVLISPLGDEAEGMFVEMDKTEYIQKIWKHPFSLAPYLQTNYIPLDDSVVH